MNYNQITTRSFKKKGNCVQLNSNKNYLQIISKCNKHLNGIYTTSSFEVNNEYNIIVHIKTFNCSSFFYYGNTKIFLNNGINNFNINVNSKKLELGLVIQNPVKGCYLVLYNFSINLIKKTKQNIISYNEFINILNKKEILNNENNKKISKYIYKTAKWNYNELPTEIINVFNQNCNKSSDYKTVYFSDNDMDNFIKSYYPNYFLYYNNLIPGAFRADVFRLLILYSFGGIYYDIGHVLLKDMNDFIKDDDELILVREPDYYKYGIHNAFIACYPKHPIIKKMIERIINNIKKSSYCNNCLDITGPLACGKAFNVFFGRNEEEEISEGLITIDSYKIKNLKLFRNDNYIKYGTINFNSEQLIKIKFDNYYKIMYNNNKHYGELYRLNFISFIYFF